MAKRDKKEYVENLAEEAEEAAARQDLETLYTISKTLRGGYSSGNRLVKDENGRFLSRVDDILKRWQENFHSILNRPNPENTVSIPEDTQDVDINTEATLNPKNKEGHQRDEKWQSAWSRRYLCWTAKSGGISDIHNPLEDLPRNLDLREHA